MLCAALLAGACESTHAVGNFFRGGATTYTTVPPEERAAVERELRAHPEKYLRTSMHVTPLFGDGARRLLSDKDPELVRLIQDPKGAWLSPGASQTILPVGTRLRIVSVEFPTKLVVAQRDPFSPYDKPWVILSAPGQSAPLVLVMPSTVRTEAEFLGELEKDLDDHDPTPELEQFGTRVADAVRRKVLVPDMPSEAVEMAWGHPDQKVRRYEGGLRKEEWVYAGGARRAFFEDGQLVRTSP